MQERQSENVTIVKNTIYLYVRMIFVMFVMLYTSRVVLQALGEEDYGIHNVVGGLVLALSFLGSSISGAISRYFAFEIGRSNVKELNLYFIHSLYAFVLVICAVIIIGETIGLWLIRSKLTIGEERITAAIWVFHFSLLSFIFQLFFIPFNSMIIAQEKMNIYAYVSIVECLLKLLISYVISIVDYDRLIIYAFLLCITTILTQLFYGFYCKHRYKKETKFRLCWEKSKFYELTKFSGWILFGTVSDICKGQGLNIMLNIFFNPIINTARAISYQINNAMNQFVSSFFMACRPQITKYYAQEQSLQMLSLVYCSSRICSYLFLILSLPITLKLPIILEFWLGQYPLYTIVFTKLVILITFLESISYPLTEALIATGRIKWYQIVTGGIIMLNLPISYVFLSIGCPPESTLYVSLLIGIIAQISRIGFMKHYHKMKLLTYLKEVIVKVVIVSTMSFLISYFLSNIINKDNILYLALFSICSFVCTFLIIYVIGISRQERIMLNAFFVNRMLGKS